MYHYVTRTKAKADTLILSAGGWDLMLISLTFMNNCFSY